MTARAGTLAAGAWGPPDTATQIRPGPRGTLVARARAKGRRRGSLFTARFYKGEDGYIVAYCRELPGCVSQGRTLDEARVNIREAMVLYLETLAELAMRPKGRASCAGEGRAVKVATFSLEPMSA